MSNDASTTVGDPKDPVTHPDVPDDPHPTEPEGAPAPAPATQEDDLQPDPAGEEPDHTRTESVPDHDPVPPFPEPLPGRQ